jgi:hypothetical protein
VLDTQLHTFSLLQLKKAQAARRDAEREQERQKRVAEELAKASQVTQGRMCLVHTNSP